MSHLERSRMIRTIAVLAGAAAVAAVLTTSSIGSTRATPTLNGTVGPGFTITLTSKGKKVTSLTAGTYRFVIADKADIHNFVLEQQSGGTFEKSLTDVPFMGTKTVTVKLTKGNWKYYCMPHEASMFGNFTVK
jgi:plastocyanin